LAPGQDNALTVSLGFYDSSSAVALGYAKRINSNTQLFSTVGYGSKTGKVGVSAGLQFNWKEKTLSLRRICDCGASISEIWLHNE
jgi:hypothetical protein